MTSTPVGTHDNNGSTAGASPTQADAAQRDSMTFGIFDWLDMARGADQADVLEGRLAMVEAADGGGEFATYHLAEHHGTPLGLAPSPSVFIAAAAQRTTRIRLAPTVYVLPLYDTLRLAQEIGMLDQLTRGRLDLGLGRGSVPIEGEFYGHDVSQMAKRYAEMEPALLETLARDVYVKPAGEKSHRGDLPLYVTTRQKPNPPLWYPTTNPETVPRIAKGGFSTIYGFAWFSPSAEEMGKVSEQFFAGVDLAERSGGRPYAVPGHKPRFGTV
jgi:alkanesulfonate monooxygenase SsuD/methylene tetrahydromethanopterin reductase-like flavin-dependent oxidoreductase (luciferase family)